MNLSKLYKSNSSFKPSLLLDRSAASSEPVWKSLVKIDEDISGTLPVDPEKQEQQISQESKLPQEASEEISPSDTDIAISKEPLTAATVPPAEKRAPLPDIEAIREEAFNSGLLMGRKQAEEDFENSAQTFINICNELDQLRETILRNSVDEMQQLVLAIAAKIIRESVQEQCETITATIKEAIHLAVKSDEFQIQLNPKDLSCIEEKRQEIIDQIRGLNNIVLIPDSSIERGGCLIESSCCTVDASIAGQLKIIQDSIIRSPSLDQSPPDNSTISETPVT